jgi:hypothetical protein
MDVQKLLKAADDISALTNSIKELAGPSDGAECEEEEEPPVETAKPDAESEDKESSAFSFGFRAGFNFSHVYEEYHSPYGLGTSSGALDSEIGFHGGFAFDIAISSWFHLQPGLMYMQKGATYRGEELTLHYLEIPCYISLKIFVVRLNAGPYYSISLSGDSSNDFGFSYGGGFDIGSFYIGVFYDDGFTDVSTKSNFKTYNRSLGFNLGYNL